MSWGRSADAHQEKLQATDRKVSKQGRLLPVHAQRRELYFSTTLTENTEPGNLIFPGGTGFESDGCADRLFDQPVLPAKWQLPNPGHS